MLAIWWLGQFFFKFELSLDKNRRVIVSLLKNIHREFPTLLSTVWDTTIVSYCCPELLFSCLNHVSFGKEQTWKGYGIEKKTLLSFYKINPWVYLENKHKMLFQESLACHCKRDCKVKTSWHITSAEFFLFLFSSFKNSWYYDLHLTCKNIV